MSLQLIWKIEQQETIKIFSSKIIRDRERRKMEIFFAKGQNSNQQKFISHQSPPERAYQTDLFGHSLHWIGIKRYFIHIVCSFQEWNPPKSSKSIAPKRGPISFKIVASISLTCYCTYFFQNVYSCKLQQERGRNFRTSSFIIHLDEKQKSFV